jgi:hypothetical protein
MAKTMAESTKRGQAAYGKAGAIAEEGSFKMYPNFHQNQLHPCPGTSPLSSFIGNKDSGSLFCGIL